MSPETEATTFPTSRRLVGLLVPIGLAMLLFGLLVWPGLAYNFSNRLQLSTNSSYKAFNPDIAAAGDYVAAVWSEGYNGNSATKERGDIYLKSAHATTGWERRIKVFTATSGTWGREPRLAFDPTDPTSATVHVVWAQASGCPSSCDWNSIKYATCTLNGDDSCNSPQEIVSGRNNALTPDVAVDDSGNIHVVWQEGPIDATAIKYCKKDDCASPTAIDTGQHPSLVFANGYLHLVWDTGSGGNSTIKYERDGNLNNSTWDGSSSKTWWSGAHASYQEPSFPTIGANDTAVYVVWAVQGKSDDTTYALAFDFSNNTGASWQGPASGFGRSIPENEEAVFTTTWVAENSSANELYSLQPDVVVTGTGASAYAHVVWHGKEGAIYAYEVWYSYLEGYNGTRTWFTPTQVVTDTYGDKALPAIAVGDALSETHVAFVEDADAGSFADIEVWYIGANASTGGIFLPIIMKNAS